MADAGTKSLIDFDDSGPKKVTHTDPHYKRIFLACLVNAAYILEIDRQRALHPHYTARASTWCIPFHYQLKRILFGAPDGTIFGAVFSWSNLSALKHLQIRRPSNCPKIVIALRGTLFSAANIITDLRDDFNLILQQIHKVSRLEVAIKVVREMVVAYGAQNVCLTGHSLGAAIALKAARIMAEEGYILETYLFNPPFFSLLSVRDEKLGVFIHKLRATAAGCLAKRRKGAAEAQATFLALQKWCPNLYINVYDPVSRSYLYYFRARESSTAHQSIFTSLLYSLGRKPEPHHLIPSANLFINSSGPRQFKVAHGLYQWWSEETQLQTEHYSLNVQEFLDRMDQFTEVPVSVSSPVST